MVLALAGCDEDSDRDRDADGTPSQGAPGGADSLGPLAVVEFADSGGSLASAGTGVIDISSNCAHIVLPSGAKVLPVWHLSDVAWVSEDKSIRFDNGAGELSIHDGDRVTLGGESLHGDAPEKPREVPWVNEPAASCDGEPFVVDEVTLEVGEDG